MLDKITNKTRNKMCIHRNLILKLTIVRSGKTLVRHQVDHNNHFSDRLSRQHLLPRLPSNCLKNQQSQIKKMLTGLPLVKRTQSMNQA